MSVGGREFCEVMIWKSARCPGVNAKSRDRRCPVAHAASAGEEEGKSGGRRMAGHESNQRAERHTFLESTFLECAFILERRCAHRSKAAFCCNLQQKTAPERAGRLHSATCPPRCARWDVDVKISDEGDCWPCLNARALRAEAEGIEPRHCGGRRCIEGRARRRRRRAGGDLRAPAVRASGSGGRGTAGEAVGSMGKILCCKGSRGGSGEGGIRTPDTLLEYGALAKRCFRPLSHLSCRGANLWRSFRPRQSQFPRAG